MTSAAARDRSAGPLFDLLQNSLFIFLFLEASVRGGGVVHEGLLPSMGFRCLIRARKLCGSLCADPQRSRAELCRTRGSVSACTTAPKLSRESFLSSRRESVDRTSYCPAKDVRTSKIDHSRTSICSRAKNRRDVAAIRLLCSKVDGICCRLCRGGARLPPAPPATPAGRLEPPAQEVRTACEEARTACEEARTTCEEAGRRLEEAKEVNFCLKTTVRAATETLRQQRPSPNFEFKK